jgi:hypothetical protein
MIFSRKKNHRKLDSTGAFQGHPNVGFLIEGIENLSWVI